MEPGQITVSQDLLRAELAQLELRLVRSITDELEKKATVHSVDALSERVGKIDAELRGEIVLLKNEQAKTTGASVYLWRLAAAVSPFAAMAFGYWLGGN